MGGAIESILGDALIDGYAETDVEPKEALSPGADDDAPTGKDARPVIPAEPFADYMQTA